MRNVTVLSPSERRSLMEALEVSYTVHVEQAQDLQSRAGLAAPLHNNDINHIMVVAL